MYSTVRSLVLSRVTVKSILSHRFSAVCVLLSSLPVKCMKLFGVVKFQNTFFLAFIIQTSILMCYIQLDFSTCVSLFSRSASLSLRCYLLTGIKGWCNGGKRKDQYWWMVSVKPIRILGKHGEAQRVTLSLREPHTAPNLTHGCAVPVSVHAAVFNICISYLVYAYLLLNTVLVSWGEVELQWDAMWWATVDCLPQGRLLYQ